MILVTIYKPILGVDDIGDDLGLEAPLEMCADREGRHKRAVRHDCLTNTEGGGEFHYSWLFRYFCYSLPP